MYYKVLLNNGVCKRSLYHETLDRFNRSLIYRTDKPTLPGCVIFACESLDEALLFPRFCTPRGWSCEIWTCTGNRVTKPPLEILNSFDVAVRELMLFRKAIFLTDVILLEKLIINPLGV